jgi:hypothetical protein
MQQCRYPHIASSLSHSTCAGQQSAAIVLCTHVSDTMKNTWSLNLFVPQTLALQHVAPSTNLYLMSWLLRRRLWPYYGRRFYATADHILHLWGGYALCYVPQLHARASRHLGDHDCWFLCSCIHSLSNELSLTALQQHRGPASSSCHNADNEAEAEHLVFPISTNTPIEFASILLLITFAASSVLGPKRSGHTHLKT